MKKHMLRCLVWNWEQKRHRRLESQYNLKELWADAVNFTFHGFAL